MPDKDIGREVRVVADQIGGPTGEGDVLPVAADRFAVGMVVRFLAFAVRADARRDALQAILYEHIVAAIAIVRDKIASHAMQHDVTPVAA